MAWGNANYNFNLINGIKRLEKLTFYMMITIKYEMSVKYIAQLNLNK